LELRDELLLEEELLPLRLELLRVTDSPLRLEDELRVYDPLREVPRLPSALFTLLRVLLGRVYVEVLRPSAERE
jgi:hypothetical protein